LDVYVNVPFCQGHGSFFPCLFVFIRNTVIEQRMNVTRSVLDDIQTKQLQWYGHVQRLAEGRLPKGVMEWRPAGRRKQGRPKLTWVEGIIGLMGEKGIGGGRLE
jgi:hypothetical protein